MKNFSLYSLSLFAAMILSSCSHPPMSRTATVTQITEDLQLVVAMESREEILKLCGIKVKAESKEYLEQFQGDRVAIVKFGKFADIFVPDGNGGELYLNGILVMKNLAEVNENEAKRCSDPSVFETAKKLRKS